MSKVKFDLMRRKPQLDINTLNYVWDTLWRYRATNGRKNEKQRAVYSAYGKLMEELVYLAEQEEL